MRAYHEHATRNANALVATELAPPLAHLEHRDTVFLPHGRRGAPFKLDGIPKEHRQGHDPFLPSPRFPLCVAVANPSLRWRDVRDEPFTKHGANKLFE